MTSPSVLIIRPEYVPATRAPQARVAPRYRERVSILAFGLVGGFVVAAAILQALANGSPSDQPTRIEMTTASLSANAFLTEDTLIWGAPDDSLGARHNASNGSPLYLLGRSPDGRWLLVLVVGSIRISGWVLSADVASNIDLWELPAFRSPVPAKPAPGGDLDTTWQPGRA
jgi:hypothetical protein